MKQSPLHSCHVEAAAHLTDFGGWELPVRYTSISAEHQAVREDCGLFDISHMGNVYFEGPLAARWLDHLLTNDVARLEPGQGQYTLMLNAQGGVCDDLILYRLSENKFYAVLNAAVLEQDLAWLEQNLPTEGVALEDCSANTAGMALQGPEALDLLARLLPDGHIPPRHGIAESTFLGHPLTVVRTGYTGEDGVELFLPAAYGPQLWKLLSSEHAARPCGLGARDSLRLEAGLPLNGHELGPDISPLQAGLSRFVALDKPGGFIGQQALQQEKAQGPRRRLRAFRMEGKCPPPRSHYSVYDGDRRIGEVTSGLASPSLGYGIGFALLEADAAQLHRRVEIEIRQRRFPATLLPRPLYKRS